MRRVNLASRLLLVAAFILVLPTVVLAPPPPQCTDADGDGFGTGCVTGPDCNDDDPDISPADPEICNNVDDDCDTVVDEGSTTCGLGVCLHTIATCSGGATQTCDPMEGATPEICDGQDNDCNGAVDDVPGQDADGDGFAVPCDCDDADPFIHPGAVDVCKDTKDNDCNGVVDDLELDGAGRGFCFTVDPFAPPVAGQALTLTLRTFHEDGVTSITYVRETDPGQTLGCGFNATYCEKQVTLTQSYQGPIWVEVSAFRSFNHLKTIALPLTFGCGQEHCANDPAVEEFVSWMRTVGYGECIVSATVGFTFDALKKKIAKNLLDERPTGPGATYALTFYDIVPTDPGASFTAMTPGAAPLCVKEPLWPAFCPNKAVPADPEFLEEKFNETFGATFDFTYERRNTYYLDEIGEPERLGSPPFQLWNFPSRSAFVQQFPPHSIVHYAIDKWSDTGNPADALPVNDLTGGGNGRLEVDVQPTTKERLGAYSHEWGHTWGFGHSFTEPGTSPATLDGIMDNTYLPGQPYPGDPLSPEERYAMEPVLPARYADQTTFAATYTANATALFGGGCGQVDPALPSGRLTTAGDLYQFDLDLANNGTTPAHYVGLRVFDGDATGRLIEERVLETVSPGTAVYRVTVPALTSWGALNVTRGRVLFVLDQVAVIPELSDANNALTVNLQDCPDQDGDGYSSTCFQCWKPACPLTDCHDQDPAVYPGQIEGPYGAANCLDGKDNNCNSAIDGFDLACSPDTRADADHATGPGRIAGGNYAATQRADNQYETLEETLVSGISKLSHIWRFDGVQAGFAHELVVQASRTGNTEGDDFIFSYSTDLRKFTTVLSVTRAQEHEQVVAFGTTNLSGTVYLRVVDKNTTTGAQIDQVKVDYLAIRHR